MGRTLLNIPTKNSNELSKKKPKLKPLLLTPFRPVDTTTTWEHNTKKNKKLRPNFSDPCPRPTPKSPPGGLNTKPMPSSELKNSKKPRRSLPPNFKKWKNWSNPPKPNALPSKKLKSDNWAKLKIFRLTLNEPTLLPLLWTKNSETSIRFSLNTSKKKRNSRLNS